MFDVISPEELERRLGRPGVILIDLRPEEAYRDFHIAGAVNFPNNKMSTDDSIRSLLPYNDLLILYCERGPTSFAAARKLESLGYRTAALAGGIRAWKKYRGIR